MRKTRTARTLKSTRSTKATSSTKIKKATSSMLESLMEYGFMISAIFWTIVIGVAMFKGEISQSINIAQSTISNLLSFAMLLYLSFALVHFVFSIVFVAKESEDNTVLSGLTAAVLMFLVVLFV